jgi:hypothetical protein
MANIKPRYQVEPFEGDYEVTTIRYTHREVPGRKTPILRREREVSRKKGGWMVYTARGESVHVRDAEGLRQLGIDLNATPPMVDMDSGEEVAPAVSLKKIAAQRTSKNDARVTILGG